MFDHRRDFRAFIHRGLLAAMLVSVSAGAAKAASLCQETNALVLNTTWRGAGRGQDVWDCFQLAIPAPGILTLDVAVPGRAPVRPKLSFSGDNGLRPGWAFHRVHETPASMIMEIQTPGTYLLAVAAEDPAEPLAEYKLRNAFVADFIVPDEVRPLDRDPPGSCPGSAVFRSSQPLDPGYVEIMNEVDPWDCDVLGLSVRSAGVLVLESGNAGLRASLHTGSSCGFDSLIATGALRGDARPVLTPVHQGEHALVLDSFAGFSGPYTLDVKLFATCDLGEVDDHGDSWLCATRIEPGDPKEGEVDNPFGDDEDFFTFALEAQTSVELRLRGQSVHGALYDEKGQALAPVCDKAPRACRRIGTLIPGRYYVRIESSSAAASPYVLTVAPIE